MKKITNPGSYLIEQTALQMAAIFYEAGCNSGLKSKHKTARHFAAHNIENFIPHAIVHLREMWLNPNTPEEMRMQLHEMFMERINDEMACSLASSSGNCVLPNLDIAKVIPVQDLPAVAKAVSAEKRSLKERFNGSTGL